jgi:phosphoglycolate phosphatase
MKSAILFDLDGTLLDTLEDLKDAVNYTLRSKGYPERTLEEVRCFVGNGARKLMELAVPAGADVEEALSDFRTYYNAHCQVKTRPYAGIEAVLDVLKKEYPVAIVSNKPDSAVKTLCADYFPGLYALGEAADCPRKPAPHMVYKAMEELGVQQCIYVGDSEVDVLTAKNAGVPCISVLWGFRNREELVQAGADCFCEKTEEIPRKIEELIHGK